ncbi:hypothetical protein BZA05DRAFT_434459 [Tricharina praecox]|uniref:uncharacterized protein n=1 Tax=Tricharina praecox TaxID=43433 RepID=UPI00221F85BB|nr:uncharacterized protein BZA05DRAFT_434459 [Tricharina praecox]KAI5856026.1 hypothetical protein BZA05DRAFT_434459 [Tricharina praecox]
MKLSALLLLTALQLAVVPSPIGAAPSDCKAISTDSTWPTVSVWTAALPGIEAKHVEDVGRPDYFYTATNATGVQAAVKFAAANNLRLVVVNSGHDFLGRNDAPSGLSLDISKLTGVNVLTSFTPGTTGATSPSPSAAANVVKPVAGQQAAVTFGAGVSTQALNDAIAASGLFTLGAAHGSVKTAGGWGQAGGHAPLSSKYGLGVDQVLEYKVVTADGKLVIANSKTNTDLFWALRGGGGSTFGVVVEATVKAYPSPTVTVTNWWINATDAANPGQGFWDAAAYLHSQFPALNAKGVQGYYYVYPAAMKGIFLTADTDAGEAISKALWDPVLTKLGSYSGMFNATIKFNDYANYKAYFDARFGAEHDDGGHEHKRWLEKRHGDMTEPMGITPMDSRLLGQTALQSTGLAAALKAAMPQVPDGQLRGHLVGGGKVMTSTEDTSVLPAWRKAYVHLIGTGVGLVKTDSLRTLAPDMGAYVNEASSTNPNWKTDFWGTNYAKLSTIKTKYDPTGVFWATPGINADQWAVKDGRLCKSTTSSDAVAPANDNKNYATRGSSNEDILSAFPGTSTAPGHDHGDEGENCEEDPHSGHDEIPAGFIQEPDLDYRQTPTTPGATFTKTRHGPYNMDAMGMIANRPIISPQKPCSNCYVVALQAGLEYADGTPANVDTGAWLHHMVLVNAGTGKYDLVCGRPSPKRLYAAGNERTTSRINGSGKYGLAIASSDRLMMIMELMNESNVAMTVYLTMTYEWIPMSTSGYKEAHTAWLDVGNCGGSDVPAKEGVFELKSNGWRSTVAGRLLFASGHVHDGGHETAILLNGKEICVSRQLYGMKPGYTVPEGGLPGGSGHDDGGHGHEASKHISTSGICKDYGTVNVGDTLTVVARYNTTMHPLMPGHDGTPHPIMGISRTYIGP